MSARVIETVLQLSGEGAYAAALKACGNEMKVLKSELAAVSSEYRNNANSVDALTAKSGVLAQMYATQAAKVDTLKAAVTASTAARAQEQATLDDLRAKYEAAKQAMDAAEKSQGKNSQAYLDAKASVEALRDAIIEHQAKLTSAENATTKYTVQLNRAQVELNGLADQQTKTNQQLEEARSSADGCAKSIDQYGNAVGRAAGDTADAASATEALASAMVASGVKQGAEELAAALLDCAAAAGAYETAVAKTSTISDESVKSQQELSAGVLELSNDLHQYADSLAEAAYEALSSGVSTANVLDFVRQASQLAVAGFTESGKAVDVLTTILNAYGLEASQTETIASKLVKTQDLGKITVDQLGECMGRVIPSAAAYGVSLDNIATSYALMTAKGVSARNTTTYLTRMLDELADSGSKVSSILQAETGKSFTELMADGQSLGDVLQTLFEGVDGSKTAFSELWGQATAGRAALSLLGSGAESFNSVMVQMANSSGTVAKNYEKMASTSEFASQKVEVATKNLQIAIGGQLNPILNELKNAGAGIMDTAAEVVAQNPALVAAIVGVVTALSALAAGLSVVAGVKALNAAMQALNLTLSASPWGLVAAGAAGLIAALATLGAQSRASQAEIDALSSSAQALNDVVSNNGQAFEDSNMAIDAAVDTVDRYIDRLAELEAVGEMTSAQQQEYAMLLERIKNLMPEIQMDVGSNGMAEGGADAIREQADAWEALARAKASASRMETVNAAVSDAEYERAVNQLKLNDAQAQGVEISNQLAIKQAQLNAAIEQYGPASEASVYSMGVLDDETARGIDVVSGYRAEIADLQNQQKENQQEQENLTAAIEAGDEALKNAQEEVEYAKEALKQMGEASGDAADEIEDSNQRIADSAEEMSESQRAAYEAAAEAAIQNINKQFGLFDKLEAKSQYSVEQMMANLESQGAAFENYTSNLVKALERGVDQGLVAALSDGSAASMGFLAEIVTASDEQIAELNAIYGERNMAGAEMAGAMAEVVGAVQGIEGSMYSSGYASGSAAISGVIDGLRSRLGEAMGLLRMIASLGGGGGGVVGGAAGGVAVGIGGGPRAASLSISGAGVPAASPAIAQPASAVVSNLDTSYGITGAVPAASAVSTQSEDPASTELAKAMRTAATTLANVQVAAAPAAAVPYTAPVVQLPATPQVDVNVFVAAAEKLRSESVMSSIAVRRAAVPDYTTVSRVIRQPRSEPVLPMLGRILKALENGASIVLSDGTLIGTVDRGMGRRNVLSERGAR